MPEVLSPKLIAEDAERVAGQALAEDGSRDITSAVSVDAEQVGSARIEAREPMIFAGTAWADAVVRQCGLDGISWSIADGATVGEGSVVGELNGNLRAILRAERPLLNLLQRACGVATMTRRYVDALAGTECRVLHTRKTTPGLRLMEAAAVMAGGGALHRLDLAQVVMIKDNHWQALTASGRTVAEALETARAAGVQALYVEVESEEQLLAACRAGATRLLIDNQEPQIAAVWTAAARALCPNIEIEATGGITFATIREFAAAGVDFVSTGAITHSVRAADLGIEVS